MTLPQFKLTLLYDDGSIHGKYVQSTIVQSEEGAEKVADAWETGFGSAYRVKVDELIQDVKTCNHILPCGGYCIRIDAHTVPHVCSCGACYYTEES